jgi:hypothetical protein
MSEYTVFLDWDKDAGVWVADNDEIPLALESGSLDELIDRVRHTAPEILKENGKQPDAYLDFISHPVDGEIKSRFVANKIMKQAGIDHHF